MDGGTVAGLVGVVLVVALLGGLAYYESTLPVIDKVVTDKKSETVHEVRMQKVGEVLVPITHYRTNHYLVAEDGTYCVVSGGTYAAVRINSVYGSKHWRTP